jgi:hypothetical protein
MTKKWSPVLAATAALVVALALGCGGDDEPNMNGNNGDKGGNGNHGMRVDVQNGTWRVTTTIVTEGQGIACNILREQIDTTATTTDELCELDIENLFDVGGFPCDLRVNNNEFTISCTLDTTQSGCVIRVSATGSGSVSESSFQISGRIVTTVLTTGTFCDLFGGPCTTMVSSTGQWISGESNCPDTLLAGQSRWWDALLAPRRGFGR